MARGQFRIIPASGDASAAGRQVKISATTSGGANTLHTASSEVLVADYRYWDYLTIEAASVDSVTRTLTILWGGTTNPDDYVVVDVVPGSPPQRIIADRPITGGLVVKAFASATNVVLLHISVSRFQVS